MDFDNIQKIWDTQNNTPMYTFNESTLHTRIQQKSRQVELGINANELGLTAITWIAAIVLSFRHDGRWIEYLPIVSLVLLSGYILWGRYQRKKQVEQYDRTILGSLDTAIHNQKIQVRRSQTFALWYILPTIGPAMIEMLSGPTPLWKFIVVPGSVVLSILVVGLGLYVYQKPKQKELQRMRDLLVQESQNNAV